MIDMYIPSLTAPTENSADWYRNFHSSFYMSQMVKVLLSYMDSYIAKDVSGTIAASFDQQLSDGIIAPSEFMDGYVLHDKERLYSIDVEQTLREILGRTQGQGDDINHMFACMGFAIKTDGYVNRKVDLSLDDLKSATANKNWYQIAKGFLNIWEFLFLFSNIESALRAILDSNKCTSSLIGKVIKSSPQLIPEMEETHGMSKKFLLALWSLYSEIRNLYSHTHGVFNDKKQANLIKAIGIFRVEFDKVYRSNLMLSSLVRESEELFVETEFADGKFYLLGDAELNIFRNCIAELATVMDKLDIEAQLKRKRSEAQAN